MAGAFTAVADDLSSMYWNPAGLGSLDSSRLHLQLGHSDYFAGTSMEWGAAAYRLSANTILGVSLSYLNSGDMAVTTEFQPLGTGQTFRATDMGIGISLASVLTDNFQFGVTARYLNERIAELSTDALVFDFGFQYNIGLADTRFAVGFSNFGFNAQPQGSVLVPDLEGGILVSEFEQISAPAVFRLGLAWDPIIRDQHLWTVAAQLNHPTDDNETYAIGTEYTWRELLVLRAGYLFGLDRVSYPSAGFGLRLPKRYGALQIDYGFTHRARLGEVHRITLGFMLIHKPASLAEERR
jgi:hypothetical protein